MNGAATRDYLGAIKRVVKRRPNPLLVDRGIDLGDGLVAIAMPDELPAPVVTGEAGTCRCCGNWHPQLAPIQIGEVDYGLCAGCKARFA